MGERKERRGLEVEREKEIEIEELTSSARVASLLSDSAVSLASCRSDGGEEGEIVEMEQKVSFDLFVLHPTFAASEAREIER